MSGRRFGVTLLSTPTYYLFSEEEAKAVYYNLIKFIKYKYKNSDYDYSIFVGLSNVDGDSVDYKYKTNGVGRPRTVFMPKSRTKGIKYVNWHLHVMVCGAPLGTMVRDIEEYLQKILNKKLEKEEFDKSIYDTPNFYKHYYKGYNKNLDVLMSGILEKRKKKNQRVPRCSLTNLNVNRRKTKNRKEDYEHIIKYIEKQSILTQLIESKGFTVAYFDIARKLNLLAKPVSRKCFYNNKYKGFK